jgi:hypothetical protein
MSTSSHDSLHHSPDSHHASKHNAGSGFSETVGAKSSASFPAVTAPPVAQMQLALHMAPVPPQVPSGEVIQRYYVANIDGVNYQASESTDLAVSVDDAKLFHAGPQVEVALKVLKLDHFFPQTGNRIFSINVDYIKDCGEYALKLMAEIYRGTYDRKTHSVSKTTVKTDSPQPGIGDAFYVNSGSDPESGEGKPHFNHHYGVVVAKSSNDVVTAEADSTKDQMAFHMYNTAKFGQGFKETYVTKGKLAEIAESYAIYNKVVEKKK